MEKFRKIKTFENYEGAGAEPAKKELSNEEINERIKEVISNVIKCRQYFELLQDTAEHVYTMLEKQIPPNSDAFANSLHERDSLLAGLMDDLMDLLDNSNTMTEIDEIVMTLKNLDKYTEDNMDAILSGKMEELEDDDDDDDDDDILDMVCPKCKGTGENKDGGECDECDGTGYASENDDDDDEEEEEDDDNEYVEIMKPEKKKDKEDQLKRKTKPTNENLKRRETSSAIAKDIEDFLKKQRPERPKAEKPKKKVEETPIVKAEPKKKYGYINGIYIPAAKKLNGRKVEIIKKSEDIEDSYDLYDPLTPGVEGEVNIKGMPKKYIFKEKPTEIIDTPPKRERARATKKK